MGYQGTGGMVTSLDSRRLVQESAPVAVILLFWMSISWFVRPVIATGLLRAGMIMAVLYTVVRGLSIANTLPPTNQPTEVEGILRENVRAVLPAGVWFLLAHAVFVVEGIWDMLGIPGVGSSPAEGLAFVFIGAGVASVLLYALSLGVPRIRATTTIDDGDGTAGATPMDD